MKNKLFIIIIITVAAFFGPMEILRADEKLSEKKIIKQLPEKYKKWMNLTHYIITKSEKKIFLKLTNNTDRDSFINLFWKMRDPSKGTPQNEYKEEHIKRFKHADRYFKYGTPLPGWKTDRAKIYILLGPPVSRNEISMQNFFYPIEIWDYYGGPHNGLPTSFRMVFYKRYGAGTFRLYIPAVDGPSALVRGNVVGELDRNNYSQLYSAIYERDPAIANISLNLVPGEPLNANYSPSLRGPILVSNIYNLPKKKINSTYARNFLKYKGIVRTSSTTDYINVASDLYVLKDPLLGLNFVHFAIQPERVSVEFSQEINKYYFNFNLMVILKKGEETILQYEKKFPYYCTKDELETKLSHGMIFTDHFPVVEGKFKLIAVLQNSANSEISYLERMIETTAVKTSRPRVYGPFISYLIQPNNQTGFSPFNIIGHNIKIDPKRVFGLKDILSTMFYIEKGDYSKNIRVEMEVVSLDENRKFSKTYSFDYPQDKKYWYFTKGLDRLNYGNYHLKARVMGEDGSILADKKIDFQVSPISYVPHPPLVSKTLKKSNQFFFYLYLASQSQSLKQYSKADTYYQQALSLNSTSANLIKNYASFLFTQKNYNKVLSVIEGLKGQEKEMFSYYALKGKARFYKKQYGPAVDDLLEANKIYDSDLSVLNTLGFALIRTGQKAEAVKALSASLKINSDQENIKKVLGQISGSNLKKK